MTQFFVAETNINICDYDGIVLARTPYRHLCGQVTLEDRRACGRADKAGIF